MRALRNRGCRLVLIDTPPAINEVVSAAIAAADLVLIPVQATPDDLRAVGVTVEATEAAHKPLLFVINRVKPRVRLTADAAVALSQHGAVAPPSSSTEPTTPRRKSTARPRPSWNRTDEPRPKSRPCGISSQNERE